MHSTPSRHSSTKIHPKSTAKGLSICSGPSPQCWPMGCSRSHSHCGACSLPSLPGKRHSTWCPFSGSRCCRPNEQCALSVCTPSQVKTFPLSGVQKARADGWQVVLVSLPSHAQDAANPQPHQQPGDSQVFTVEMSGVCAMGQPGPSVHFHPHPTRHLSLGHLLTLMSRYTTSLECKYSRADTISAP